MGVVAAVVECAACGRQQPMVRRQGSGRVAPVNPETRELWWSRMVRADGADDAPMAGGGRRIEYACSRECRERIQQEV